MRQSLKKKRSLFDNVFVAVVDARASFSHDGKPSLAYVTGVLSGVFFVRVFQGKSSDEKAMV